MSTILVEARRDPQPGAALDAIAATCKSLGHDVFRWRGPQSGRVPHWRWLFPCDLAIVWNGMTERYQPALQKLRRRGTPLLFTELGWYPQRGHIQIDPAGINAVASWAAEPLKSRGRTPLAVRQSGDLLVVLQLDWDTQITRLSPWFADMQSFVEFLCRNSALPVRVRHHPRQRPPAEFIERVQQLGGTWDESPSLAAALQGARALACVNSSCGVEALAAGLPVLCYGLANYRHPGAVYCLDDGPQATRVATESLAAGRCDLFQEPANEAASRILSRQWAFAEIPQRLPPLVEAALAGAPARNQVAAGAAGFVSRLCNSALDGLVRWTRDLPPKVLPARPAF
jgi:hypothetical protein